LFKQTQKLFQNLLSFGKRGFPRTPHRKGGAFVKIRIIDATLEEITHIADYWTKKGYKVKLNYEDYTLEAKKEKI
jgi:hypothetical protein